MVEGYFQELPDTPEQFLTTESGLSRFAPSSQQFTLITKGQGRMKNNTT